MAFQQNTVVKPEKNRPDRLGGALKWANELSDSRLREVKKRHRQYWTTERRAEKARVINDNKPWRCATGPKTLQGKAVSCQNALKHGLCTRSVKRLKQLLRAQRAFVRNVNRQTWKNIRMMQENRKEMMKKPETPLMDIARELQATLKEGGIPVDLREVKMMMKEAAGLTEEDFILTPDQPLIQEQQEKLSAIIARRLKGEPLSRIVGVKEFWGLEFEVTPDTLDPRPDTETLIEAVLKSLPDKDAPLRVVDLGTGTGCILISLLTELPNAAGVAVDISDAALGVARRNAERHGVSGRFEAVQGSWFGPLAGQDFDLIVSNPPYIPDADIQKLSGEVKNHDPVLALSGGENGLESYQKIISGLKKHLNHKNRAFLEIGFDQLGSVSRLVEESNLCVCDSTPDIAGIPRVVEICRGDK